MKEREKERAENQINWWAGGKSGTVQAVAEDRSLGLCRGRLCVKQSRGPLFPLGLESETKEG